MFYGKHENKTEQDQSGAFETGPTYDAQNGAAREKWKQERRCDGSP